MTAKFLIDECLSPSLVQIAANAGYSQSTCVRDRGWSGLKDWQLVMRAVDEDFTLVTHNAADFRGKNALARGGLYREQSIHAGLICLSADVPMDRAVSARLFSLALKELRRRTDLVNTCMELVLTKGAVELLLYDLPP